MSTEIPESERLKENLIRARRSIGTIYQRWWEEVNSEDSNERDHVAPAILTLVEVLFFDKLLSDD